jgi:hypothetical protein
MKFIKTTFITSSLLLSLICFAEGDKRQKVIDFEDEVVEGLNKRPFDSVSQLSEKDRKRKKIHLYRKRGGFSSETAQTLSVMRLVQ